MRLFLRLTTEVNDRLRTMMRYHSELSRYIDEALTSVDLEAVELLSGDSGRGRGITAVYFPFGEGPTPFRGQATRLQGYRASKQRPQGMVGREAYRVERI